MAKENQSEIEEKNQEKIERAKKTLEDKALQGVFGSNQVRSNPFLYGQIGVQGAEDAYNESIHGEKAQEIRKELYEKSKQEGDSQGVYGEPSIGNYEVSKQVANQIEENKIILPLGELEKMAKNVADGLESDIPEELKKYVPAEIQEKIIRANIEEAKKGKQFDTRKVVEKGVLTEEEADALGAYQALSQAYDRGTALSASNDNYFSDYNQTLSQISEKYKKDE